MPTTSVSLLERLRRPGDAAAWERFVRLYTPLLVTWARRLGLQDSDAADLTQDVLTLLVRKLPDFAYDPAQRFRGWLLQVMRNQFRAHRRRRRLPVEPDGVPLDELEEHDPTEDFEEAEYRQYLVGRALDLMRTDFEPTTWRACWEHVVLGRPAHDVAAELGITPNAVYIARSRVLRRLREELRDLLD